MLKMTLRAEKGVLNYTFQRAKLCQFHDEYHRLRESLLPINKFSIYSPYHEKLIRFF